MLAVAEYIGGCLIDGNRTGIGGRIRPLLTDMELKRFEFIVSIIIISLSFFKLMRVRSSGDARPAHSPETTAVSDESFKIIHGVSSPKRNPGSLDKLPGKSHEITITGTKAYGLA